jgi:hypothetical protein
MRHGWPQPEQLRQRGCTAAPEDQHEQKGEALNRLSDNCLPGTVNRLQGTSLTLLLLDAGVVCPAPSHTRARALTHSGAAAVGVGANARACVRGAQRSHDKPGTPLPGAAACRMAALLSLGRHAYRGGAGCRRADDVAPDAACGALPTLFCQDVSTEKGGARAAVHAAEAAHRRYYWQRQPARCGAFRSWNATQAAFARAWHLLARYPRC